MAGITGMTALPAAADCNSLPNHGQLKSALIAAVSAETSGLNMQMWAALVDRDGVVCDVTFSRGGRGAQWPGSRVISAQKANTANAFSLAAPAGIFATGLALSTANRIGSHKLAGRGGPHEINQSEWRSTVKNGRPSPRR